MEFTTVLSVKTVLNVNAKASIAIDLCYLELSHLGH